MIYSIKATKERVIPAAFGCATLKSPPIKRDGNTLARQSVLNSSLNEEDFFKKSRRTFIVIKPMRCYISKAEKNDQLLKERKAEVMGFKPSTLTFEVT